MASPLPQLSSLPPVVSYRAHKREVKVRLSCWSQELEIQMEIAWHMRSVSLKGVTVLMFHMQCFGEPH